MAHFQEVQAFHLVTQILGTGFIVEDSYTCGIIILLLEVKMISMLFLSKI